VNLLASPQKENGFSPIANEIIEQLVKFPLNGTQWRIIAVLWRFSYGYSRKEAELSESYVSKATGIDRRKIRREISVLIDNGFVLVTREATFTSPRILKFNKNYDEWVRANLPPEDKEATTPGGELATTPGGEITPQKSNTIKQDLKKDIYSSDQLEILEFWNTQGIVKHNQTAEMQKSIKSALKKYEKDIIIKGIINYSTIFHDKKYFYSHIWTLGKFLKQANGLPDFLEDGQAWLNYKSRVVKNDEVIRNEVIGNDGGKYGDHEEYARILDGK
jgi:phage replication O-like protein O